MTDEAGNTHPDDDAVRRLLADARHTEPMPADVASRMDDLLADLRSGTPVTADVPEAEPAPAPSPAPAPTHPVVISLAVQRRRRAAGILLAAAAVVVGAVVVVPHLPTPGSSSSSPASAADNSGADLAGGSSSRTPGPEGDSGKVAEGQVKVRNGRVVVRPEHFASDAAAARRLLRGARAATPQALRLLDRPTPSCVVPRADGTLVSASYERAPAVLVFHRPESSTQVVDLFVCGSSRPVRSTTLSLP